MIPKDIEARIVRLYEAERWTITTIARQVGMRYDTVRRVLRNHGADLAERAAASRSAPCSCQAPADRTADRRGDA